MALLLFAAYNNAGKQFKQSAAQACLYFSTCVSLKWLVVTPRGRRRKPWHELKLRPPAQLFKMKFCSRRPESPTMLPTSLATCVTSSRPCYGNEIKEEKAGSHFNSAKSDFVAATKKKRMISIDWATAISFCTHFLSLALTLSCSLSSSCCDVSQSWNCKTNLMRWVDVLGGSRPGHCCVSSFFQTQVF